MNRYEKIRALDAADAYFITSEVNVRYASGFTGDSSELLLAKGGAYFFTDSRYTLQAKEELPPGTHIIKTGRDAREAEIAAVLRENGIKSLGIERANVTLDKFSAYESAFGAVEYVDISGGLLHIRMVKDEGEIEKISKAARASEQALESLLPLVKPGISELDIKAELLYRMHMLQMESAFDPIVAGGVNSAKPHARPSSYKLKAGDFLTIDFGCKYEGYCSDMTRTFGIGNIDAELKTIYDIVKIAHEKAAALAEEGAQTTDVDFAARGYIGEKGYGACFGHGTGHGVGLEIHELPVVDPTRETVLKKGMIITVEPGIYVENLGGVRIEDTFAVGRGSLYTFTKELIIL